MSKQLARKVTIKKKIRETFKIRLKIDMKVRFVRYALKLI